MYKKITFVLNELVWVVHHWFFLIKLWNITLMMVKKKRKHYYVINWYRNSNKSIKDASGLDKKMYP